MRMNTKFGMLVELVRRVSYDVIPFTLFTMMWVVMMTMLYIILGSYDTYDTGDHLIPFVNHVISTFENMVGNINNPSDAYWSNQLKKGLENHHKVGSYVAIYLIWFLWFMNQFFLLIILLNFLIAVIS